MGKKSRANRRAQQLGHRTTSEPIATDKALESATDDGASFSENQTEQERDESSLAGEESEDATRRIRSDAEFKAQKIVDNAQQKAQQVLATAEEEAEKTRAEAKAESEAVAESAETTMREQLAKREAELQQQHLEKVAELKAREDAVATNEHNLKRREAELMIRQEDFEFEQETLALQRKDLRERWASCSPDRVWVLEHQLVTADVTSQKMAETVTKLQQEVSRLRDAETSTGGRPLSALVNDLEQSESRVRQLSDKLASVPSEHELLTMRQDASEVGILREQNSEIHRRVAAADERALRMELGLREIEQVRVESEALRILNDELRTELRQNAEILAQRTGHCFPQLLALDSAPARTTGVIPLFPVRNLLPDLVDHVRKYAASGTPHLYYSEADIRAYIAGLATSRLLILQGLSGTGKTSLPRIFAAAIAGAEKRITVQSNWRDRHELLGYYNDFNKRFSESEFTQAVYGAGLPAEEDIPWFIILDEMNLARCEYYFADFLSLMENPNKSSWDIELMSFNPSAGGTKGPQYLRDGRYLPIPQNVWFVGTANQDESTFEITDKVYDRSQVVEFRHRHEEFSEPTHVEACRVTFKHLERVFNVAKNNQSNQLDNAHWDFLDELDRFMSERFDITFGNRIKAQLRDFVPVYVACGGKKEEALDIQIARKILRKLENRHDSATVNSLADLEKQLQQSPSGWKPLTASLEIVQRKKVRSL